MCSSGSSCILPNWHRCKRPSHLLPDWGSATPISADASNISQFPSGAASISWWACSSRCTPPSLRAGCQGGLQTGNCTVPSPCHTWLSHSHSIPPPQSPPPLLPHPHGSWCSDSFAHVHPQLLYHQLSMPLTWGPSYDPIQHLPFIVRILRHAHILRLYLVLLLEFIFQPMQMFRLCCGDMVISMYDCHDASFRMVEYAWVANPSYKSHFHQMLAQCFLPTNRSIPRPIEVKIESSNHTKLGARLCRWPHTTAPDTRPCAWLSLQ